jgi:ribosomal protein S10
VTRPVLGVDVDSTVWDLASWVREAVLHVTGDAPDPRISTWTGILETYGERATQEIFDRALSPRRIREREPYPGCAGVLKSLQSERGVGVHFITRSPYPEDITPHLLPWLRTHFGPEVGLTVTGGDKLPIVRELGAFGMIDDRPDTLGRVAGAGLWTAAMLQPWNRTFLTGNPDVRGFSDWREVPGLLPAPEL